MSGDNKNFMYKIEWSAIITVLGVILLFSTAIGVTLIAPGYIDPSWVSPSSSYQKQMYEISDPNVYISSTGSYGGHVEYVQHLIKGFTLIAIEESDTIRIVAPENLKKYINKKGAEKLNLTTNLLLLRRPQKPTTEGGFNAIAEAEKLKQELTGKQEEGKTSLQVVVYELFESEGTSAFSIGSSENLLESWIDKNYTFLEESQGHDYHKEPGVIYIHNPLQYRVKQISFDNKKEWRYDPEGVVISTLDEIKKLNIGFRSRKELIETGEHIYAIEGCWYCHTDQTRTLIQDVVLNGSETYPAPPSSANEYIYQRTTFPSTRRIGPDLSRVGVKRPSRDWHKGHFWSPKTASKGSIMPAFQHFFDNDPRGTSKNTTGIPNYKFEALYQYLMTKGTRITPPNQAWWLGKDPVQTLEVIEGRKKP
jgi:cytochrome c oxidase cbb3-type subunit 2